MQRRWSLVAAVWISFIACGGEGSSPVGATSSGDAPPSPTSPAPTSPSSSGNPPADAGPDSATAAADPTGVGPFAITELDRSTTVAATGDVVPLHVAVPTGKGPFPVLVFAHGFQIPSSQYYGTIRRLASFGYVALTADYPAGFTSVNTVRDAKNLVGALDWAKAAAELAGKVDATKSGVLGHSRGGKAAVLAAAADSRFAAVLGLDPVDAKPPLPCDATTECPDSRDALAGLAIPSAMLGETLDGAGGGLGQACAPAAGNFETFYAKAKSPSYSVTINGASHMSFVEDLAACGFTCSACKTATTKQDDVLSLARAFAVAFFERHLKGDAAYSAYLDGAKAKALWVTTGRASISSK
jgi:chlorophyllase